MITLWVQIPPELPIQTMRTVTLTNYLSVEDFDIEIISILNHYSNFDIITEVLFVDKEKVIKALLACPGAKSFILKDNMVFLLYDTEFATVETVVLLDISSNTAKLRIIANSIPTCEKYYNLVKNLIVESEESDESYFSIYYLAKEDNLSIIDINVKHSKLNNIKSELYPDIDPEKLAAEFIESDDNLLIVHGDPGTSKTSFIKYLAYMLYKLKEINQISYAKDWKTMNCSQFWPRITDNAPPLLILDDLDHDLTTKTKRSPFVSNLLSYLDGVLTNKSNKVIISTNQPIGTIDSALLRSGRCFDCIELHKLDISYAKEIWRAMNINEKFPFTKDKISQAEFMSIVNKLTKQNKARSYIKTGPKYSSIEEKLGL